MAQVNILCFTSDNPCLIFVLAVELPASALVWYFVPNFQVSNQGTMLTAVYVSLCDLVKYGGNDSSAL